MSNLNVSQNNKDTLPRKLISNILLLASLPCAWKFFAILSFGVTEPHEFSDWNLLVYWSLLWFVLVLMYCFIRGLKPWTDEFWTELKNESVIRQKDESVNKAGASESAENLAENKCWLHYAYPLQQVIIKLQGTRHSNHIEVINLLETVLKRLRAGEIAGSEHDDYFGYSFNFVEESKQLSFFDEEAEKLSENRLCDKPL